MKPEELARQQIDEMLIASGWIVQDRAENRQKPGGKESLAGMR